MRILEELFSSSWRIFQELSGLENRQLPKYYINADVHKFNLWLYVTMGQSSPAKPLQWRNRNKNYKPAYSRTHFWQEKYQSVTVLRLSSWAAVFLWMIHWNHCQEAGQQSVSNGKWSFNLHLLWRPVRCSRKKKNYDGSSCLFRRPEIALSKKSEEFLKNCLIIHQEFLKNSSRTFRVGKSTITSWRKVNLLST